MDKLEAEILAGLRQTMEQFRAAFEKFSEKDNPNPQLKQLLGEWGSILKEYKE